MYLVTLFPKYVFVIVYHEVLIIHLFSKLLTLIVSIGLFYIWNKTNELLELLIILFFIKKYFGI